MVHYVKCPRCELNYIDAETQEFCEVCLKEIQGIPTGLDEIEEAEDDMPTELCPICGENMIRPGEKMCEECRKKTEYEDESEPDPDDDDEWREYLDDEGDLMEDIDIGETFDEEEPEEEEDEEYEGPSDDDDEDLEYVTGDEIYTLGGDDDDDDDDEKGDDEDF